jgi:putative DNA primase/helicase
MRIDTQALLCRTDIVQVVSRYVQLRKDGIEHVGLCPFHGERTPSLMVNKRKQIYKCFGCGAGGDSIDFLMRMGRTFKEACEELESGSTNGTYSAEQRSPLHACPNSWQQSKPPGPATDFTHYKLGQPHQVWAYHMADGHVWGYACRFNHPDGKKDVLPFCYATDGERSEWRFMGFSKPRPIYNLHLAVSNPEATILLVEGEKTADAVQALYDPSKMVVVTWLGGANGIRATEWSTLNGRVVVAWPDNDWSHTYGEKHPKAGQVKPWHEQPGNSAMLTILTLCQPSKSRWIRNPEGLPCGWDAADREWTIEELGQFLRANMTSVPAVEPEPEPDPMPPLPPIDEHETLEAEEHYDNFEPPPLDDDDQPSHKDETFFRFLGYEKTEHGLQACYFYSNAAKSVIKMTPASMSKANLLMLAPINWWEDKYPKKSGRIDIDSAQNWLVQRSFDVGSFSDRWLRGRGAWIDGTKVVIHAGDRLVVDGKPTRLSDFQSRYIYEIADPLSFETEEPLKSSEANQFMNVVRLINWERDINAYLLAGWCVIAPICGTLRWRPHIWITGSAGTGKSWVFQNVVRRILGDTGLAVQGETSEAGLRQTLNHDALPVVFDEAEGEDKRAQDRMQQVLALMRAGSSSDGGVMAKGTAGGNAKTFRIRSCFAFASIAVQVAQMSDRSRVTILGLKKPSDKATRESRWKELQRTYNEVLTDEYCRRLRARTVSILPTILKNAETFANAVAHELGEQRTGDQVGTLLAGAYSLFSSSEITFDKAVAWIRERDWSEETMLDGARDEMGLIAHLLDQITQIEASSGRIDRAIGELVQIAAHIKSDYAIEPLQANDRLKRIGLKVDGSGVFAELVISNSAANLKKVLEGTPWARNHHKILLRIEGAHAVASAKFAAGIQTRAVKIPLSQLFDE